MPPAQRPSSRPQSSSNADTRVQQTSNYRPSAIWSPQDDQKLLQARREGSNWQPIAVLFPGKTPNACRKRHERLRERQDAEDWDGVRLERLASTYMEMRREIWSVLANKLGEKWQVVEAKCMERGIKNLTAASRSANRRDSGTDEDDSGIGMEDAEHEVELDHTTAYVDAHPLSQPGPSTHHVSRPTYSHAPTIASMLASSSQT